MNPYKACFKHLFGAKYEGIKKSAFVVFVVFFAIFATEVKMVVAASVLFLTAIVFTMGVMWQALGAKRSMENLQGMLELPFENRQLVLAYVSSMSAHTLLTKSAVVLVIFFAIGSWHLKEIIIALLCACNGCMFAVIGYLFRKKAKGILVLVWLVGYLASIFFMKSVFVFAAIVVGSLSIAGILLSTADVYAFYAPGTVQTIVRNKNKRGNFLIYLIRYLVANKYYMVNTVGLGVIACVLPMILNQFGDFYVLPIGLAILSLNTPLCILLSVDGDLEQAVRILPGQGMRLGVHYCVFLAGVNMLLSSIYLISWQLQYGDVNVVMIVSAVIFAMQGALCSVGLEWVYPLRNWKLESDLYHHPRKYIVPAIMIFLAGFVCLSHVFVWVLAGILIVEIGIVFCMLHD